MMWFSGKSTVSDASRCFKCRLSLIRWILGIIHIWNKWQYLIRYLRVTLLWSVSLFNFAFFTSWLSEDFVVKLKFFHHVFFFVCLDYSWLLHEVRPRMIAGSYFVEGKTNCEKSREIWSTVPPKLSKFTSESSPVAIAC